MPTPYIGFGHETLKNQPKLKAGDMVKCPTCEGEHPVIDSDPPMVLYFKCGENTYLAGLDGHSIMDVKSDVSGEL